MSFAAFANFAVPSSKAGLGDYSVQPRTITGATAGAVITSGLTSLFAWRGIVPNNAATVDLVSTSIGVIDTQPVYVGRAVVANADGSVTAGVVLDKAGYAATATNLPAYDTSALPAIARKLLGGCRVLFLGDSETSDVVSPRNGRGILRAWDNIGFIWIDNYAPSATDEGIGIFSNGNPFSTQTFAGGTLPDGQVLPLDTPNTINGVGSIYLADGTPTTQQSQLRYDENRLAGLRGDLCAYKERRVTLGVYKPVNGITINAGQDVGSSWIDGFTLDFNSSAPGFGRIDCDFPAHAPSNGSLRGFTNGGTAGAAAHVWMVGAGLKYHAEKISLDTLASGGWYTINHLPPSYGLDAGPYQGMRYTDAQQVRRYGLTDWPDVVFLQIGQNVHGSEQTGVNDNINDQFRIHVEAIIDRHVALHAANGRPRPLFALIVPWQGSIYPDRYQTMLTMYAAIASARPYVGVIPLFSLVNAKWGAYASWAGTLLSDGVHQSDAGSVEFMRLVWEYLLKAAATTLPTVAESASETAEQTLSLLPLNADGTALLAVKPDGTPYATAEDLVVTVNPTPSAQLSQTSIDGIVNASREGLATEATAEAARAAAVAAKEAAEAGGGNVGPGAYPATLHFEDAEGNPVANADVWVTTDEAGTNTIAGTLQTNSQGDVVFLLDKFEVDGVTLIVYYRWMEKGDFNSINGLPFTCD